jgi:hypothetical protein
VALSGAETGNANHGENGIAAIPSQTVLDPHALRGRVARAALQKQGRLLEAQADAKDSVLEVKDLQLLGNTALADAKSAIAAGSEGFVHFNYGFILRSRRPDITGDCSDLLYVSSLLDRVRRLIYQPPPRAVQDYIDHTNRLSFNALRAYLTQTDRDQFLELFPHYQQRFKVFEEFVTNVVYLVVHMQRQNSMAPNTRSSQNAALRSATATVAKAMLTHIVRHEGRLNAFQPDVSSLVSDYVVNPEYTLLYLKAIGLPEDTTLEGSTTTE